MDRTAHIMKRQSPGFICGEQHGNGNTIEYAQNTDKCLGLDTSPGGWCVTCVRILREATLSGKLSPCMK